MVAPRAVDKLPTLLLLSLASTSASLTLPTLGSFRTTPTSARSPAATAYAVGPNPAAATRSKAPLRNMVAPAFSYAGLGAVAAGAAKVVSVAAPAYGMVTFGAIAAPALLLLLEFIFLGGGERVAKMMGGERADSYVTGIANDVALKAACRLRRTSLRSRPASSTPSRLALGAKTQRWRSRPASAMRSRRRSWRR